MRKSLTPIKSLSFSRDENDATSIASVEDIYARISVLLIGVMPGFFALISWQPTFEYNAMRHFSLPIVIGQAAIIMLAMLSGSGVLSSIKRLGRFNLVSASVFVTFAALATLLAHSDPSAAKSLYVIVIIHGLFLMILAERFAGPWRFYRTYFLFSLMAGLTLYTVIVLCLAASVLHDPIFNWLSFGAGVTNVRQIGFYGLALTGFSAGVLAAGSNRSLMISLFLFSGMFLTAWSGGRAAFASILVSVIAVAFACPTTNRLRFLSISAALLLISIPISTFLAPSELYGAQGSLRRLSEVSDASGVNAWSSNRLAIWQETWGAFLAQPLVGHGEGQFRHQIISAAGLFNHPHNALLQFLYSWGLVASLSLITLLSRPVYRLRFAARSQPQIALPAIGLLAGLGSMSLFDGSLYYPFPVMCTMLAFALLSSVGTSHSTPSRENGSQA